MIRTRQSVSNPDEDADSLLTRRQLFSTVGGAAALVAAVAACSDDGPRVGPPPAPTFEPNGIVVNVQSIDNTFRPSRIEVTPGTEVVWTNFGHTEHNILAVDGTWGVETQNFQPGATFSHVFGEFGEVPYYCSIHADVDLPQFGMVGTIVVVDA